MTSKTPSVAGNFTWIAVGIVIGVSVSIVFIINLSELSDPIAEKIFTWTGAFFIILFTATTISISTALWATKKFLGKTIGSLNLVVESAAAALTATSNKNVPETIEHTKIAFLEFLAWQTPIAVRKFVVNTLIALLVAFAGIAGTLLLVRQNNLIQDQNVKIDLQTVAAEAQRRSVINSEVFAVLPQLIAQSSNLIPAPIKNNHTSANYNILPNEISIRVAAIMGAATPYRIAEVPELRLEEMDVLAQQGATALVPRLADRATSPERGQLISIMHRLKINMSTLRFNFDANFQWAQLRGINLIHANLSGLDLMGSDFRDANLEGVDFEDSNLINVDLTGANISGVNFQNSIVGAVLVRDRTRLLYTTKGIHLPPSGWKYFIEGRSDREIALVYLIRA